MPAECNPISHMNSAQRDTSCRGQRPSCASVCSLNDLTNFSVYGLIVSYGNCYLLLCCLKYLGHVPPERNLRQTGALDLHRNNWMPLQLQPVRNSGRELK